MRDKTIFCFCFCGFAGGFLLENATAWDAAVQSLFYSDGRWLIDGPRHAGLKNLCYTGPKVLLGLLGGGCAAIFLFLKCTAPREKAGPWRRFALLLCLSIALVPLAAASLKALTGVREPSALLPFGGGNPHIGMLSHLWKYGAVDGGRAFPAGHASGGFALLALACAPARRTVRLLGFAAGMSAGWSMALYQMARGEHFFSHSLTTMFLAGCIVSALRAGTAAATRASLPETLPGLQARPKRL